MTQGKSDNQQGNSTDLNHIDNLYSTHDTHTFLPFFHTRPIFIREHVSHIYFSDTFAGVGSADFHF